MSRLTGKKYWAESYPPTSPDRLNTDGRVPLGRRIKRRLGPRWAARVDAFRQLYFDHLLFRVILPPFLADSRYRTAIEIGSAPGEFMVRLHRAFDLEPYGVDYADGGVELNRIAFRDAGVDPGHAIRADVFDRAFQERWHERFDVVLSRGFIEHFTDPGAAVDAHVGLLRPGGLLVISVPNLRGFNYCLQAVSNRAVLAGHNREIMRLGRFAELFAGRDLYSRYCSYFGIWSLGVIDCPQRSRLRPLYDLGIYAQNVLDLVFKGLFSGRHRPESGITSPHLIYIGERRG